MRRRRRRREHESGRVESSLLAPISQCSKVLNLCTGTADIISPADIDEQTYRVERTVRGAYITLQCAGPVRPLKLKDLHNRYEQSSHSGRVRLLQATIASDSHSIGALSIVATRGRSKCYYKLPPTRNNRGPPKVSSRSMSKLNVVDECKRRSLKCNGPLQVVYLEAAVGAAVGSRSAQCYDRSPESSRMQDPACARSTTGTTTPTPTT